MHRNYKHVICCSVNVLILWIRGNYCKISNNSSKKNFEKKSKKVSKILLTPGIFLKEIVRDPQCIFGDPTIFQTISPEYHDTHSGLQRMLQSS